MSEYLMILHEIEKARWAREERRKEKSCPGSDPPSSEGQAQPLARPEEATT